MLGLGLLDGDFQVAAFLGGVAVAILLQVVLGLGQRDLAFFDGGDIIRLLDFELGLGRLEIGFGSDDVELAILDLFLEVGRIQLAQYFVFRDGLSFLDQEGDFSAPLTAEVDLFGEPRRQL